jgi:hypothetical protein
LLVQVRNTPRGKLHSPCLCRIWLALVGIDVQEAAELSL